MTKPDRVSIRLDANMMLEIRELSTIYKVPVSVIVRMLIVKALNEISCHN
ncbi:hypothetical protein [Dysgonomonas sp.]|nr:hypothetical protein [Dysgonomonas sp.]